MINVMLDLETLGKAAGCPILSIGAVTFDAKTGRLGPTFYVIVRESWLDRVRYRLSINKDTIDWWDRQSYEAKEILRAVKDAEHRLPEALQLFNGYLKSLHDEVAVWGNGSDFDNAIIQYCYEKTGIEPAWKFWNNRCYRTLKNLNRDVKMTRTGTHHNALDDAISQADHAIQILRKLRGDDPTRNQD